MLEEHEEDIEEWFFKHKAVDINKDKSSSSLENFLCRQGRMFKTKSDQKCLDEVAKSSKKKKKKMKGETTDSEKVDVKHTEL